MYIGFNLQDVIDAGKEMCSNFMRCLGAATGTQTNVPGKSCVETKESKHPGKSNTKKQVKANTKGRKKRR